MREHIKVEVAMEILSMCMANAILNNENANRLIRRLIPKGIDITPISEEFIQIKINTNIDLAEQNISREANSILIALFRDYFAT